MQPTKIASERNRNSLNRAITNKQIEELIENIPRMKSPGPNDFTPEFC
jgi:hypothetical protein